MRGRGAARRGWLRGLLLVAAVATTGVAHARIDTTRSVADTQLSTPSPQRARLSALGFDPVLADYFWVRALHLVGGVRGDVTEHGDTIADIVELVTALDPFVDHPYRFGAIWLTRDLEQVRRANAILRQGMAYHPGDWRNRFYLGYNLFYYLQDNAAAAAVLEPAIAMEGAPRYLGAFVARLRADGGDLETSALFLETLIEGTEDEFAKAEYLKAYDEIETERRARLLDLARVEFWKRQARDVRDPSELWSGPARVIRRMPPPHPHFEGFAWALDPESREIVSTFYGTRYRLHIHETDVAFRANWRDQLDAEAPPAARASREDEE